MRISLLKLFFNFSEISISSIKKAFAYTQFVEKKDKFRARTKKKYISAFDNTQLFKQYSNE